MIGEAADGFVKLTVSDAAFWVLRIVRFPKNRHGIAALGKVAIEAISREIERTVGEPRDTEVRFVEAGLLHHAERLDPVDPLRFLGPEPFGILHGARVHLLVARLAVPSQNGASTFHAFCHFPTPG